MKKQDNVQNGSPYEFYGKTPNEKGYPAGPTACDGHVRRKSDADSHCYRSLWLTVDAGYAELRTALLQNAMIIAGVITLIQLFSIGPCGGKVPIIMGTSSGFLGVFQSIVSTLGGGVLSYGAIMGASLIGGLFEGVLGAFLNLCGNFFRSVVTGSVVMAIGLSLISVGINYLCGGNGMADYGSFYNLLLGGIVLLTILIFKHCFNAKGMISAASVLFGIIVGYAVAIIMTLTLPNTGINAEGVEYTYAWVVNSAQVKRRGMVCSAKLRWVLANYPKLSWYFVRSHLPDYHHVHCDSGEKCWRDFRCN